MMNDEMINISPKLFVVITDRVKVDTVTEIFVDNFMRFFYAVNAMGSASSDIMNVLGLDGTEKTVCLCMMPDIMVPQVMKRCSEKLDLWDRGKGIAFTVPVSGMSTQFKDIFSEEIQRVRERWETKMETELERIKEEAAGDLIIAVINQGFSDDLMDAARHAGARGGTIIHARRIGLEEMVKFFGISLQAEKEIVGILTTRKTKLDIMNAICKGFGMKTEAKGMVFSVPVDNMMGIDMETNNEHNL